MAYRIFIGILLVILIIGVAVLIYGLMNSAGLTGLTWSLLHAARWLCHG